MQQLFKFIREPENNMYPVFGINIYFFYHRYQHFAAEDRKFHVFAELIYMGCICHECGSQSILLSGHVIQCLR